MRTRSHLQMNSNPRSLWGVTMNHVAAVAAPLVGGYVWLFFGYEIIFISGALIALVSLIVTQWVNPDKQRRIPI